MPFDAVVNHIMTRKQVTYRTIKSVVTRASCATWLLLL